MSKFIKALKLRANNYGFWASLIALLPILCQVLGYTKLPADYANTLNGFLAFFVAAGIISNPTTQSKGYLDDKENVQG